MTRASETLPADVMADAAILWDYHDMHHAPRPTDVGIGLGSHDLGVADHADELYRLGMFPVIVFTGANAPTTVELFPDGEAVHYARRAMKLGVPADAIMVEPDATNTGENITLARALLRTNGIQPQSVTLISRPYQQRRAYATCRKLWPEVGIVCSSQRLALRDYIDQINDAPRVINMLVGDTQRVEVYAARGYAIEQPVPAEVREAFERLVRRGYTARLL